MLQITSIFDIANVDFHFSQFRTLLFRFNCLHWLLVHLLLLVLLNNSLEFTNSLIKNPSISPLLIKEILLDYCSEVFLKAPKEPIILDDVSNLNSKLIEIPILEK